MENEACGFSDFDRGAMRQKMAIFKRGNSVCRGTKNFEWRNFHEFHRGTMRQKMAIFKEGNSVCRGPKFCKGRCWWKSSFYRRKIGRTLPNFEYFWIGRIWTTFSMQTFCWKLSFYEKKLVAHGHISWIWFDRRTMREEMTIFKKRNNIWRGTNVFSWGRCSWKSSFYWRKIDRTWPNFDIKILSSDDKFCVQLNFRVENLFHFFNS